MPYLLALGEIVSGLVAQRVLVDAELLPEQQGMPDALYLLEPRQLLQLPLVIEDKAVASGPPAVEVLLAPHVGRARVEDATLPPLHAYVRQTGTSPDS